LFKLKEVYKQKEIVKFYKKHSLEFKVLEDAYITSRYLSKEFAKDEVHKIIEFTKSVFKFLEKKDKCKVYIKFWLEKTSYQRGKIQMKRKEFVKKIAESSQQSPLVVQKILREFVKILAEALKNGEKITISGLGQFKVKPTKPKLARNPKTGEPVQLPERKKISFRPTDWIRKYINE
jgi:DNA-binding protein HU-beta